MKAPTFRQRFQYWFDTYMSRGTGAMLTGLFLLSALIILAAAALVILTGTAPNDESFLELAWMSLLRTLDSGTMGGDSGSPFFLLMMLLVTFGGVFVVSALIGIINNGLEDKMNELRKGRSRVLEHDHTLILGWNPQIFTIIAELVLANTNRRRGAAIVILADMDKVEMEDALRERIPDTRNTRVICRSGSPIDLTDLEIASPHQARSIIVLPEGSDPDTHVIKSVLAITNNPNRRPGPYHLVTQIRDPKNMDVVRMVGARDRVQPVLTNDLIARVVAQTSRQSGLSIVYTELMNFGGDEIYFKEEPALAGRTYGEALLAYENSTVMGLCTPAGEILMNPPMETRIQPGMRLFALAEDDDRIVLSGPQRVLPAEDSIQKSGKALRPKPEKALLLGWNRSGATILRELDHYVARGSQVTVVSDIYNLDKQIRLQAGRLANQRIVVQEGDIRDRALLEKLEASQYDHVIVLAYSHLEPQEADAITLVTLLHLRDIAERDETPFSIVSEMLDLRNRELAEAARVDDFIVSEHLISLMMAQLSENAELMGVFADMFDPQGAEIYLKPAGEYVVLDRPVDFYTVTEAARRRGETAIGYRLMRECHEADKAYGVHTNPRKSAALTFSAEDRVIVIAEG